MNWLKNPLNNPKMAITRLLTLTFLAASLVACDPPGENPGGGGDDDCKDVKIDSKSKNDSSKKKCDNTGGGGTTDPGTKPIPFDPTRVCTIDKFKQLGGDPNQQVKKVDILFVMDTSGSMDDDWARVAGNIGAMVQELPNDIDIRYGVILGHVGGQHGKLYSAKGEKAVLSNQTMTTAQIATSLRNTFASGMKVEDEGSGETLFYSLYRAVRDHAKYNQNLGFFRADAALSVIFMSDEQEMGATVPDVQPGGIPPRCDKQFEEGIKHNFYDVKGINTQTTFAAVKALKGDMPVMTHAFINITAADVFKTNKKAGCIYESLGYGYFDMVDYTKGVLFSIKEDKAEGLARCGRAIRGSLELTHDFKLSQTSENVDPLTIQAVVDGYLTSHSYQALTNMVHMDNAGVFNSNIEVWYCKPNERIEWNIVGAGATAAQTSINVAWKTPELSTRGKVIWGTSANSLVNTVNDTAFGTDHLITINGLNPDTTYYAQVVARDDYGVEKRSIVLNARTLSPPPIVWGITGAGGVPTETAVTVTWSTPELATQGRVSYGLSPNSLTGSASENGLASTQHLVNVTGLNPNTTYYFKCTSRDNKGEEKSSDVIEVKTLTPPPQPVIWNITNFNGVADVNSVALSWNTVELATNGRIVWGTSAGALNNTANDVGIKTNHAVNVASLNPETNYYFQAVSTDADGVEKRSEIINVKTLVDPNVPPPPPPTVWNITNFSGVATTDSVNLTWNTSELATNGKVVWGLSAAALTEIAPESVATTDHAVAVHGLNADTNYYFQAVSVDNNGLEKRSAVIQIRTNADPVPVVWNIVAFDGTTSTDSANLIWQTPGAATKATVLVGLSDTDFSFATIPVDGYADSHMITVNGLSADTRYYFKVIAVDGFGTAKESVVITKKTKLP